MKSLNAVGHCTKNVKTRPGIKLVHRFRSNVTGMMMKDVDGNRLIVALASGKVYISNKKITRWKRIKI